MHGKGEFRWSDGRVYVGEYAADKKHGQGEDPIHQSFPCLSFLFVCIVFGTKSLILLRGSGLLIRWSGVRDSADPP